MIRSLINMETQEKTANEVEKTPFQIIYSNPSNLQFLLRPTESIWIDIKWIVCCSNNITISPHAMSRMGKVENKSSVFGYITLAQAQGKPLTRANTCHQPSHIKEHYNLISKGHCMDSQLSNALQHKVLP